MKINELKIFICLVLMIVFLIEAFLTKDVINSQLFNCLGIITGALVIKFMPNKNTKTNENY